MDKNFEDLFTGSPINDDSQNETEQSTEKADVDNTEIASVEKTEPEGIAAESDNKNTEFTEPEIAPVSHSKTKRKNRKKSKKTLKALIWILTIVILSVALSWTIIVGTGEFLGIGPGRGHECVVEIEPGMSTAQIAKVLKEAGAINHDITFRLYSKFKGFDGKYSYGVYVFNNEIGYEDLANLLMTQGSKADSVTVTIPERASIDDIAVKLEEAGVCKKADFYSAVREFETDSFSSSIPKNEVHYILEGYLFPDTYNFYSYDSSECARLAVKKMYDQMKKVFDDKMIARANEMGYSIHQVLTMASIVELEASGAPDQMADVAQVFYNRLNDPSFSTLGSSPTRKYPYGDGKYNTYICKGLPVGPLCSPSEKAIKAALYPNTEQKATYFVTDKSMNFYYNTTLDAHNSTIARLKKENNWIYED